MSRLGEFLICLPVLLCLSMADPRTKTGESSVIQTPTGKEERDEQLYLIASCPTYDTDLYFPTTLYTINGLTLESVQTVIPKDPGTSFVRVYNDEKMVVAAEYQFRKNGVWKFYLIDMDNPARVRSIEMNYCDACSVIRANLLDLAKKGLYLGLSISSASGATSLVGGKLSSGQQESLLWDTYIFVRVSGMPGGGTYGGDYLPLLSGSNGELVMAVDRDRHINLNLRIPSTFNLAPKRNLMMYVNNTRTAVILSTEDRIVKASGLGKSTFYVLNKGRGEWRKYEIDGGRTWLRGFGEWMAGFVADVERSMPSPGGDARRQVISQTGTPADVRFKNARIYSPGILFLYNADTGKEFKIVTDQGDCEVLLVHRETVYYRVNDSIYRAQISQSGISNSTKLLTNEVVPDMHWAFMGHVAHANTPKEAS